ncbi:1-deoxy-D-xylulose 5-phosphate reductoisomerase [subsurface metagenome]
MPKGIAILGSTGSIGTQTLQVIAAYREEFVVEVLTANKNADLLINQAMEFQPNAVVIGNESEYEYVTEALKNFPVKVFAGSDKLESMIGTANEKGTGLGLRLCQELVHVNKGTIKVKSSLETGTTFSISLPGISPVS